jgi:radical SAM protein with 4Fe4S-binding SPASM domain
MDKSYSSSSPLHEFSLWKKTEEKNTLLSLDMEITARCNHNCRHCYINLPANDKTTKEQELPIKKIKEIVDEAVSLGALWSLLTGGEPLLRKDFFDIYVYLKEKGFLVSLFTNATLITEEHINFFKKYPPRNIEVSVYGVTEQTFENVTRRLGSFAAFRRGLDLLLKSGIKTRLKAMALRSNVHELPEISRFCREKTKDYFRFDPFLHLRYDRDPDRNREIISERLSPDEIVELEKSDPERFRALEDNCDSLILADGVDQVDNYLFSCSPGSRHGVIGYDGKFRLCYSLWHPDTVYDLTTGSLSDAFRHFIPRIRQMQSNKKEFLEKCRQCKLINLCMWCPAHAHLETGEMDTPVDYFCQIAHARAEMLGKK